LGFPHGMSVKFGLWTFHELSKRQKNFDFIDFGCPSNYIFDFLAWYAQSYKLQYFIRWILKEVFLLKNY